MSTTLELRISGTFSLKVRPRTVTVALALACLFSQRTFSGDARANAVIEAAARENDLGVVVASLLGAVGEVIRIKRTIQCPPTRPGEKGRKFHFVCAAVRTSAVSMPSWWQMADNSFMRRCEVALRVLDDLGRLALNNDGALCMPAVTTAP